MKHEKHLDLFSGIGGFSLAADRVFGNLEHTFVEWDEFCTEVLKKHWPEAEYHKDIKQFVADTHDSRRKEPGLLQQGGLGDRRGNQVFLLTGGFPCQPFSQAGRRKGTDDDRYLWPPMLECVSLFRPEWVIAENVSGLVSWNEGLVLEQVCTDLENENYEVQPLIVPAVAVNAPHKRDRVWIVAHSKSERGRRESGTIRGEEWRPNNESVPEREHTNSNAADPGREHGESWGSKRPEHDSSIRTPQTEEAERHRQAWSQHWAEVAASLCRVDDGLPRRLDRNPRLKALGNAIVPQVAEEIMRAIKKTYEL